MAYDSLGARTDMAPDGRDGAGRGGYCPEARQMVLDSLKKNSPAYAATIALLDTGPESSMKPSPPHA